MRLRLRIDRIVLDASVMGSGERERFARELEAALRAALPAHLRLPPRPRALARTQLDLGPGRDGALAPALGTALAPHVLSRAR